MKHLGRALILAALLGTAVLVSAQDSLSTQVLALLARANSWSAKQTFNAGVGIGTATPSVTTATLYTPDGSDLYWAGSLLVDGGSGLAPHNILSTSHADTTAAAVVRGDLMTGQGATPTWSRLAIGAAGTMLRSDGTDASWSTDASALTALNATQLTSGTVPLARLSGITNTEIDAAAAIAWTKVSKTGASLADLTTRSAADLSSGTLPDARLSTNVSLFGTAVDTSEITNGAVTMAKLAGNGCSSGQYLYYSGTAVACVTLTLPTGTVTSVALSLPAIFSVSGSPVTSSGTLTASLATQTANTVWAGPTSGSAAAPTFRALVNDDLPTSGVSAGTYLGLTINSKGVVTGRVAATFSDISGTLGFSAGGTGLTSASDDTTMVSNGSAWQAQTLCNSGTSGALQYTQATNLFSCLADVATTNTAQTLTNKTLNVESTGNVVTTVEKFVVRGGLCQNVTATTTWSLPTSNAAAAACLTGSQTQLGTLDYADGANSLSAQYVHQLPADWTGTVSLVISWVTSATAGDVKWQLQTACASTGDTMDPSWNTADTVTSTAQGVASAANQASIASVTMTGCAAGDLLFLKLFRDPADGSDTLAATARVAAVELTYRRAQ